MYSGPPWPGQVRIHPVGAALLNNIQDPTTTPLHSPRTRAAVLRRCAVFRDSSPASLRPTSVSRPDRRSDGRVPSVDRPRESRIYLFAGHQDPAPRLVRLNLLAIQQLRVLRNQPLQFVLGRERLFFQRLKTPCEALRVYTLCHVCLRFLL